MKLFFYLALYSIIACSEKSPTLVSSVSSDHENNEVQKKDENKIQEENDSEITPPKMVSGAFLTCHMRGNLGGCTLENNDIIPELKDWKFYEVTVDSTRKPIEIIKLLPTVDTYSNHFQVMFEIRPIHDSSYLEVSVFGKHQWSSQTYDLLEKNACLDQTFYPDTQLLDEIKKDLSDDFLQALAQDDIKDYNDFTKKEYSLVGVKIYIFHDVLDTYIDNKKGGGMTEKNFDDKFDNWGKSLAQKFAFEDDYKLTIRETKLPGNPLLGSGWLWGEIRGTRKSEASVLPILLHSSITLDKEDTTNTHDDSIVLYPTYPIAISNSCLIPDK